ncbi:MAG: HAD hydrolase family protein, partial [Erysipelotrichaceae bacterium]|nr:HAD hydrolase family protein [Erysipelotrichaceae bacterium]
SAEQCAAFGDSENDIPMLRAAGLGVAMGNAMESAREAADYITDNASEDGVYKALKKFGIL